MMNEFKAGVETTRPCVITLNGGRISTQAVAYEAYGDRALLLMLVNTEDIEFSAEAQEPETEITRLAVTWKGTTVFPALEEALTKLLATFGLEWWAQGYDYTTNERDVTYRPAK